MQIKRLLIFVISLVATAGDASTWFVNKDAHGTGNGTSWTDAWKDFNTIIWNNVNPGDTIYVAGGSYTYFTVGKSGTSGNVIAIKRGLSSDPVTSVAGWKPAYDSPVIQAVPKGQSGIYINQGVGAFLMVDARVKPGGRCKISSSSNGAEVDQLTHRNVTLCH